MAKHKETTAYSVKIHVNGEDFVSEHEDLTMAFYGLGFDFTRPKTKGEITVTKGDKIATRLFPLPQLRRIFASKLRMSGIIRDFDRLTA